MQVVLPKLQYRRAEAGGMALRPPTLDGQRIGSVDGWGPRRLTVKQRCTSYRRLIENVSRSGTIFRVSSGFSNRRFPSRLTMTRSTGFWPMLTL